MHDPRAVANLILDEGQRLNRPVSNVALQKLLYFAHGLHLVQRKSRWSPVSSKLGPTGRCIRPSITASRARVTSRSPFAPMASTY